MSLRKAKWVGEVPLIIRIEGSEGEGRVIGTARMERLPDGNIVAHIDAGGMTAEMLRRGFSIGELPIGREDDAKNLEE